MKVAKGQRSSWSLSRALDARRVGDLTGEEGEGIAAHRLGQMSKGRAAAVVSGYRWARLTGPWGISGECSREAPNEVRALLNFA